MTSPEALKSKLFAAAADGIGALSVVTTAHREDALCAILHRIGDTVLPRTLTLDCGETERLSLTVDNGRVVASSAQNGGEIELIDAVVGALEHLVANVSSLSIKASPDLAVPPLAAAGVSVANLQKVLGVQPDPPSRRIDRLSNLLGQSAMACEPEDAGLREDELTIVGSDLAGANCEFVAFSDGQMVSGNVVVDAVGQMVTCWTQPT